MYRFMKKDEHTQKNESTVPGLSTILPFEQKGNSSFGSALRAILVFCNMEMLGAYRQICAVLGLEKKEKQNLRSSKEKKQLTCTEIVDVARGLRLARIRFLTSPFDSKSNLPSNGGPPKSVALTQLEIWPENCDFDIKTCFLETKRRFCKLFRSWIKNLDAFHPSATPITPETVESEAPAMLHIWATLERTDGRTDGRTHGRTTEIYFKPIFLTKFVSSRKQLCYDPPQC